MAFATSNTVGRTGLAGETAPVQPGFRTPVRTGHIVRVAAVLAATRVCEPVR